MKLYVTWKTLALRAEHADAFAGSYEPVDLGAGVCAFVRGGAVLAAAAVDPYVDAARARGLARRARASTGLAALRRRG